MITNVFNRKQTTHLKDEIEAFKVPMNLTTVIGILVFSVYTTKLLNKFKKKVKAKLLSHEAKRKFEQA